MILLSFENVSRRYRQPDGSTRDVLNGLDFQLAAGEVVALIGRSGAGKTTLLCLAAGLSRPTSGRVLLDGRDLARLATGELSRLRRESIGLVFQNNLCLSALPVWENVALAPLMTGCARREARAHAEAVLERVGLDGLGDAPTAMLSGGQRRRLGLARVLVERPRLLLADEPTADLDETTARQIESQIFEYLRESGAAALIVTHTDAIQRLSDRTVELHDGRLREILPAAQAD